MCVRVCVCLCGVCVRSHECMHASWMYACIQQWMHGELVWIRCGCSIWHACVIPRCLHFAAMQVAASKKCRKRKRCSNLKARNQEPKKILFISTSSPFWYDTPEVHRSGLHPLARRFLPCRHTRWRLRSAPSWMQQHCLWGPVTPPR